MPVITISGLHGTGKSTAAAALARRMGLRYVCSGEIFRKMAEERSMSLGEFSRYAESHPEIDLAIEKRAGEEAGKGNAVIDGRLSGWTIKNADVRILLTAPLETRVRRICRRERRKYDDVLKETVRREKSEEIRFKKLYRIDVKDITPFDIVMNTQRIPAERMIKTLEAAIKALLGDD
ncbi:MAG: cytidylate kinase family protein [Candidatus Hadarchaeales archaeon]